MTATSPIGDIITVEKLLADNSLTIPLYQRPYKWTEKNVNQLFSDIKAHKDKSSYRLGTIVFHQEENKKDIVDGQQRIITLLLAVRALLKFRKDSLTREKLKEQLSQLEKAMVNPGFKSEISKINIRNNFSVIQQIVSPSGFTEDLIDFLLNKCEVVTFTLGDISEAFQFFDSQNARGKDLEPHDLLKAYHLREFSEDDKNLKANTVKTWENSTTEELATLFKEYLYRIRNWSQKNIALSPLNDKALKEEITALFKGVNLEKKYPYLKQLQTVHDHVDHVNSGFPFHLDQIIINGRRFFEMTAHYQEMVNKYSKCSTSVSKSIPIKLNGFAESILRDRDSYEGRGMGDIYVRNIFDCLLIYYIDKFGDAEISRAIEKIFIMAYRLRLTMIRVQFASVNNYVLGNEKESMLKNTHNLFELIKDAIHPSDFINHNPPVLSKNDIRVKKNTKINKLLELFESIGYLS